MPNDHNARGDAAYELCMGIIGTMVRKGLVSEVEARGLIGEAAERAKGDASALLADVALTGKFGPPPVGALG